MVHNLIDLVVATVTGYCKVHGEESHKCGAMKEAGGWAIAAIGVAGLLGALSKGTRGRL